MQPGFPSGGILRIGDSRDLEYRRSPREHEHLWQDHFTVPPKPEGERKHFRESNIANLPQFIVRIATRTSTNVFPYGATHI